MDMRCFAVLAAVLIALPPESEWKRSQTLDPLHGTNYQQWSLEGKYLTPPRGGAELPPRIVVRCEPGKHHKLNGKFIDGYISINAVIDTRSFSDTGQPYVPVELKLDDRKVQSKDWRRSTDGQGAFFSDLDFSNLLYGHEIPHKLGKGDQVRKIIVGIPEYLAVDVVMQFDMPDASEIGDACGAVWSK
jgi:hypothetical protein